MQIRFHRSVGCAGIKHIRAQIRSVIDAGDYILRIYIGRNRFKVKFHAVRRRTLDPICRHAVSLFQRAIPIETDALLDRDCMGHAALLKGRGSHNDRMVRREHAHERLYSGSFYTVVIRQ